MAARKTKDARFREFWSDQHSSLHRRDDEGFYAEKAREHVSVLAPADRSSIADFACGAGELVAQLAPLVDVEVASDFSEPMLEEATSRLAGSGVTLIHRDGMSHAREASQRVWMTCGGLNQFLDPPLLREWLSLFSSNEEAEVVYLFDCVDPHRYRTLRPNSSYRDLAVTTKVRLRRLARRMMRLSAGSSKRPSAYLGSPSMGFAYTPAYFRAVAAELNLSVDFYSSRFYEYRFHAVLRKP